ncbi:hypothetical protein ACEE90_01180 [Corynebacterium phoceense]|uniref:hypothetical protein n=1 Tax=Corynebacterium phoceense TaxID=1686286 RepID=UPI00211CAF08|nr:hypothetical protein [Corynebacterium phoceense]MCQ9334280.1 hypothetical protein [Corynebacterium phoceense]
MATYPTVPRGTTFGRPIVIPESLDELRGPVSGLMAIPHSVMWATAEPVVFGADDDASWLRVYRETVGVAF